MKYFILLPLIFLVLSLGFTLLGIGVGAVQFLASSPGVSQIPGQVFQYSIQILPGAFVAGVLLSWISCFYLIRRKNLSFFSHGLILLLVSTLVIAFGSYSLGIFEKMSGPVNPRGNELALGHGISPNEIHRNDFMVLRANEVQPLMITNVYSRTFLPLEDGRFDRQVLYSPGDQELLMALTADSLSSDQFGVGRALDTLGGRVRRIPVTTFDTTVRGSLAVHPVLSLVSRGVTQAGSLFSFYGQHLSIRLFVMAASLSFFLAGSGLFQKGGVWPLLGPISGLAIGIGGISLFQFLLSVEMMDFASMFVQTRSLGYIGPGVLGLLGLIMAGIGGFLYPRTKSIQKPKNTKQARGRKVKSSRQKPEPLMDGGNTYAE